MTTQNMTCCICGNGAGRWEQHWNRDAGYSICCPCFAEQSATETPERMTELYGQPNVNYRKPRARHNGRWYHVLAMAFTQDAANAFMDRTPGASVLFVEPIEGGIFMVDKNDLGEPIEAQ